MMYVQNVWEQHEKNKSVGITEALLYMDGCMMRVTSLSLSLSLSDSIYDQHWCCCVRFVDRKRGLFGMHRDFHEV